MGAQLGAWGRSPQPLKEFLRFSLKKTLILAHFFIERGGHIDYLKASAVTSIDNAECKNTKFNQ